MVRDTKGVYSFYIAVGTPTNDFWRRKFQISDNNFTTRLFARIRSFESWRREREEEGKEEDDKKNARTASTQRINIVNFF